MIPLDELSARRRDLYLTKHNQNSHTSLPPVGFEPTVSAGERPQFCALGYGYIGARTDTTQKNQHLSGYTLQERVATFNTLRTGDADLRF